MTDQPRPALPIMSPQALSSACLHTEAATRFSASLIEKDDYCSLLLADLQELFDSGLVFKGGTCLSKVHAEFKRLSEDLDFAISINSSARQADRRAAIEPCKVHLCEIPSRLLCFSICGQLTGHDRSRQYNMRLEYESALTGDKSTIKVEVSVREQALLPPVPAQAKTLLCEASNNSPAVAPIPVVVLSRIEAYAEKVRAAFTRPRPAIRDLYDIDTAIQQRLLDPGDGQFLELVQAKLRTMGSANVPRPAISELTPQLETHLKPVLRDDDYRAFDLNRACEALREIHDKLNRPPSAPARAARSAAGG